MNRAVNAVEDEAVKGVVAFIKQQFSYLTQYHDNIQDLSSKVAELERGRQAVKDKVDDAVRKRQDLILGVEKWLEQADALIEVGKKIMIKEDKAGNRCWEAWCLHLKPRYSLSVEAKKEVVKIDKHLATSTSQFGIVVRRRLPSAAVPRNADGRKIWVGSSSSSGAHGGLESRRLILTKVMEALKNDQIRMVIICGMGGVGKTTMVNDVRKLAGDLFKEIPYAEFNIEPDFGDIQSKLAKSLGYDFEEAKEVSDRVPLLYERLNDGKILLVTDNVWNIDDLESVGIPLGDEIRGCKILLTSRDNNVRDPQTTDEVFNLKPLLVEEGLLLLRQCVGKSPYFGQTAEEIVNACGGLPLAIATIAKAIQFRSEITWKFVLRKLQDPTTSKGEYTVVFKALRASYDFLKNEKIKKLFRLCCMWPKGCDVPIENLVLWGIAVKLYGSIPKLYDAREETHVDIETLVQLNLLLPSHQTECIKMHDLVWDFALSLSSEGGAFMVHFGNTIQQWPQIDSHKYYTSILLAVDNMPELPDGLDFRNLEILHLLAGDNCSAVILPENIYNGMSGLLFLFLAYIKDPLTPKSFRNLSNLQILWLIRCKLSNDEVLMIEKIHTLKVLKLDWKWKEDLSINLGNLSGLRLLDLTGCRLQLIAPEGLSRLTCLEESYMRKCDWSDMESIEAMFNQLSNLSNLVVIVMEISFELPLSAVSVFHKVEKFQISFCCYLNDDFYLFRNSLKFQGEVFLKDDKAEVLILKAEDLELLDIRKLDFLVNESDIGHFSTIKTLIVKSCEFTFLIDTKNLHQHNVFPLLESLLLKCLDHLENIYNIQDSKDSLSQLASVGRTLLTSAHLASFGYLKYLKVNVCRNLRYIFPVPIARNLIMLERLEIYKCHSMTEIIQKEERVKVLKASVVKIQFPNLKYLSLKSLKNLLGFSKAAIEVQLPQLEELILKDLDKLTSIFSKMSTSDEDDDSASFLLFNQKRSNPNSSAFVGIGTSQFPAFSFHNLSRIKINKCERLIHVFRPNIIVGLPVLQSLSINECGSLKYVFSSFMLRSLGQLKELTITDCIMLEVIVEENNEGAVVADKNDIVKLSNLITIQLIMLPNLTGFSSGNLDFEWPSLTLLDIGACQKMKTFTSGYCGTPILDSLIVNQEQYCLDRDVNTTLSGVQQKDNEAFEEEGILTKNGLFIATDHLIKDFPSWRWGIKDNIVVTTYVQCWQRATASKFVKVEKVASECTSTSSGGGDGGSSSDYTDIYGPRYYDVNITYDEEYKIPRLWLKGYRCDYHYQYEPLQKWEVLEDIIESLLLENFVMDEDNPTETGQISLYPSRMLQRSIKKYLSNQYSSWPGYEPKVYYYLHGLLHAFAPLIPTIEIPAPGKKDGPTHETRKRRVIRRRRPPIFLVQPA